MKIKTEFLLYDSGWFLNNLEKIYIFDKFDRKGKNILKLCVLKKSKTLHYVNILLDILLCLKVVFFFVQISLLSFDTVIWLSTK